MRDIQFNFASTPAQVVPHQLLSPPAHFTGRADELDTLYDFLGDAPAEATKIIAITGVGGVGKTSLALSFLHSVRERFADGQLYAALGGFSLEGPAEPVDILGRFLRSLGVSPDDVPVDQHERSGLFRSLTDGRSIAILLDDALSAAQTRALLPGSGHNLVVVTSRRRLTGLALDGAHFVDLSPLREEAAVELLARIIGDDRAASDPGAAKSLAAMCGRLPIALCASAARLVPHRHWTIARMVEELANERRRLTALSTVEDVSVRAVFDLTYRTLADDAARLYRRLGLLPVEDFGMAPAAAVAGIDVVGATGLLETLVETNLLAEIGTDRFRYHDLVRLHALDQARNDTDEDRRAAVVRAVDWYVDAATAADRLILPARWRLSARYDEPAEPPMADRTPAGAIAWFEAELSNILAVLRWAADNRLHEACWQLCEALWGFFTYRKRYAAWVESHLIGLECAQELSDVRAQARMHIQLGGAFRSMHKSELALVHFRQALGLERESGHRLGEGTALDQLGVVALRLERYEEAIRCFRESRAIHDEVGVPRGVALMDFNIGVALGESGWYAEALDLLDEARTKFAAISEPYHEARTLTAIARFRIQAGRPSDSRALLARADSVLGELGASHDQAQVRVQLADLAKLLGRPDQEREHLQRSLALFTSEGSPLRDRILSRLRILESTATPQDASPETGTP